MQHRIKQISKELTSIIQKKELDVIVKQAEVYNRKSCNLTKSLDFLRGVLEQSTKSRDKKKMK